MYGLNIDPLNPHGNPSAAELRELGVERVRLTYKDQRAGPELDSEALKFYQAKLRELRDAGIGSLIILSYETYPNKPAFEASDTEWYNYISAYSIRCSLIVSFLAEFSPAYQVWNEPDLPPQPGYEPSLRENVYGAMLRRTREVIKTYGGENTTVVGAGLASGLPDYWRRVVDSQPGAPLLDYNAFHPYGQRPEPDWPPPDAQGKPWGFGYVGDLIERYRAEFAGPWWITESGVKDVSDEMQAEYLRRMYRTIESRPDWKVDKLIWFCYSDAMVAPYGLIDGIGQRKPAWEAYRTTAHNKSE